jgi:prepilin-type N-terminal cleavage/methylation domain-containing protein
VLPRFFSPRLQIRRSRRKRAGYTLLELAVVMMIGGIVTTMSIGKVHTLLSQQRVVHAATAVQNDLEAAFQIAGRNRKPVQISWDAAKQQFTVGDRVGSTMYYRRTNLSAQAFGLNPTAVSVSKTPLAVFPNGLAEDTLLITFSSNGITKKLYMSRTGLVRVK